ncbi:hypothetical protein SAMN05216241_102238 [Limimonas halophila]|uniref:ABC-2 family transporter protein n=1 Tax=Limimonas halophila TaxID=1082479 RepID=A0A1G7NNJ6_9PROT|nr:hypothetical protein [Limimonas halophila]SDF75563.1 hypothetical protein SAMN05216241_102238 [Limimonas halophila]
MTLPYLLLSALRDRLVAAMAMGLVAIWLVAAFAGGTSIAEEGAAASVFAAFGARLLVIGGLVLFVALQVRRLSESGELHLLLATPVSRGRFVVQAWAGFATLAVGFALAAGAIAGVAGWPPAQPAGLAVWTATLALEGIVMAALALFVALGLRGVIAGVLVALGLYVVARMMGVLLAIANSKFAPTDGWMGQLVDVLGLLLPRLDLLAQSRWLVHGLESPYTIGIAAAQAAVYTAALVAAVVFDAQGQSL